MGRPCGLPPFVRIFPQHYAPAFHVGLRAHADEVGAIANDTESATFAISVASCDRCDRALVRIELPFHYLAASKTSPWGNFLPRVGVIARAGVRAACE